MTMILRNILTRRTLTTQAQDIGQIFAKDSVQKLLKDITRFEEEKVFAQKHVPRLRTPNLVFMSDEQLKKAKEDAYEHAKARLQMPPVMAPNTRPPAVLAKDEDIVGYTQFKIMFIDISAGVSDRNRIMSVREADGTLREPTHEERSRLNHIFFPTKHRTIEPPKLFQDANLRKLLKRKEYLFILNRACIQFEPDDPRYVDITSKVYEYIDEKGDYDKLRSTRHFGPMSLYLAYNKRADNLVCEMLSKNLVEDAVKLVKIYNTCHNIESEDNDDHIAILKQYTEDHSVKKHNLELAIQKLTNNPS